MDKKKSESKGDEYKVKVTYGTKSLDDCLIEIIKNVVNSYKK